MATTITTSQTASTLPQKKGDPPNFGTVKSGRALAFDGAVDYLTFSTTDTFTEFTATCWINVDTLTFVGSYGCLFGGTYASQYIHVDSDGKLRWYLGTNVGWAISDTKIEIGQWYRVVCTMKQTEGGGSHPSGGSQGGNYNIYINGVTSGNHFPLTNTHADTYNTGNFFAIGAISTGSTPDRFFSGYMSDVQIWDKQWTEADVQNDYRHPEMLAHTFSGTSLTESNLKVWYPMTEGNPESPQTTIFDGSPKVLGSELVSTIENNTSYPLDGFVDNGGGSYTCTHSGSGWQGFEQPSSDTFAVAIGEIYKVTFNYTTVSGL